jgi:hypothetical protein
MDGFQTSHPDNHPSSTPEASDYIATLLRDSTSSHLLETLVSRCPESVFGIIWTTYFEGSLRKLAMQPVANFVTAKALERANAGLTRQAPPYVCVLHFELSMFITLQKLGSEFYVL